MPSRIAPTRPSWTIVGPDDPRMRDNAVEPGTFASGEWAKAIGAASNRAWTNAAKVIARIAPERPDARYVEGWGVTSANPVWHAWVDVPLGESERSWLRIDATPLWRWSMEHNFYGAVLEVRASEMARFAAPLLRRGGRPLCRLPLVSLAAAPRLATPQP